VALISPLAAVAGLTGSAAPSAGLDVAAVRSAPETGPSLWVAKRTEAEIYATLLDCAMDPDVAVERLISQGTLASTAAFYPPPSLHCLPYLESDRLLRCAAAPRQQR
jgi:hypothetical protein